MTGPATCNWQPGAVSSLNYDLTAYSMCKGQQNIAVKKSSKMVFHYTFLFEAVLPFTLHHLYKIYFAELSSDRLHKANFGPSSQKLADGDIMMKVQRSRPHGKKLTPACRLRPTSTNVLCHPTVHDLWYDEFKYTSIGATVRFMTRKKI